jgi:hypothetical protein
VVMSTTECPTVEQPRPAPASREHRLCRMAELGSVLASCPDDGRCGSVVAQTRALRRRHLMAIASPPNAASRSPVAD